MMTEFASKHPYHHDDSRRQISKSSSSSSSSTSKKIANTTWSDARILAQPVEKMDIRGKHFSSKDYNRNNLGSLGDMPHLGGIDEKPNGYLKDYKMFHKSDIRPSDSSYTRKMPWDSIDSTEASAPSSKSVVSIRNRTAMNPDVQRKKSYAYYADKRKQEENAPYVRLLSDQSNGVSHDNHSNSLPLYKTVDQMVNGYSNSDLDQSKESSHSKLNSNLLPDYHKKYIDLERKPFFPKHQSPVQAPRSPLHYSSYGNLKNDHSSAASQKEETSSRPNSSFWGDEDSCNDDKSLAVNISNPIESYIPAEKPRYPYSIEMMEGMFIAVKDGPEQETLKINIIENFGSGDLKDGGFSWGWSIERRCPIAPSSSSKNNTCANKDNSKSKRKTERTACSPSPKKPKVKCNDSPKSNREKSSRVPADAKEVKIKVNCALPPRHPSSHTKPNSAHVERSAKSAHVEVKSPNVRNNLSFDKHCRVSPAERRKSPIHVPSSEMIPHHSKSDCLGKNNNVIDDSTMGFITSKKERSAVYSGRKSSLEVQPLKVMCFEYLKKNILGLKIGQNVPFELLLPALKLCSPSKLHRIEEHNRHIMRYTDCLWKKFCESEFRETKRLNGEAWKDVYWRARKLREMKLKNLASSISNGMSKGHPERQVKWVGTGFNNPEKRQKKKVEEGHRTEEIPIARPEANERECDLVQKQQHPKKRSGSESSSSSSPHSVQKPTNIPKNQVPKAAKRTLAPLMSKTKKMLNLVNRRR